MILKRLLTFLPPAAVIAIVVTWPLGLQHWLAYETGSYNTPGVAHNYNFFSGSGSDIGQITLIGLAVSFMAAWYHKHNCHNEKCWRIGIHTLADGKYTVCRKHHNEITGHGERKLSTEFLRLRHLEHTAQMRLLEEIHRHVSGQPGKFDAT